MGVTAALAIEAMLIDSEQCDRQVFVVVSPGQPRRRLGKLNLDRFSCVHLMETRCEALQRAVDLISKHTRIL
jgi:hypothetical protein